MAKKGNEKPVLQEEVLYRPGDPIQIFDNKAVTVTTEILSDPIECAPFRHFGLFLAIDSTSTPTTLQIKVQFLDRWTGKWHTYKQGPFAALYYEDQDTASGIYEILQGMCAGRAMRVTLTGVGTSGSAYFTVSVALELWN